MEGARGRRAVLRLLVAGAVAVLVLPVPTGKSAAKVDLTYHGARVHAVAVGVIDFAQLARLQARGPRAGGPSTPDLLPEPQEKAEPNARITLQSPFQAPLGLTEGGASAPSPAPVASFLAHNDVPKAGTSSIVAPPDTAGAVGPTKLMVTLNNNYVIEDKSSGAVLNTVSMPTFWGPTGALEPFDPKTVYDPYNGRWLVAAVTEALGADSSILVGISDTADPSGTWHLYRIDAEGGPGFGSLWADYPGFGFNKNWLAIHVNMFTFAGSFIEGRLLVIDYPSLRSNALSAHYYTGLPSFSLQPAVTYSPTEETLYGVEHLSSFSGTYRFWTIAPGAPPAVTLVGGGPKTNPLGSWAIPSGNILPQHGGPGIDAGDSRVINAVYRNGGVFYAQTVELSSPTLRTAAQWVELSTSGDFVQGGRIDDPSGSHSYAYPSVAANAANDVLVNFGAFSAGAYASAAYAFHAGTDAPNTIRDPVTLKAGEGVYDKTFGSGRNRWGDYSNVQVDPSDGTSFWAIQEYAGTPVHSDPVGFQSRWSTWWGKITPGTAASPPPPPAPPPPPPPFTPPRCLVPNVVGRRLGTAKTLIRRKHCRVGTVTYVRSTRKRLRRVIHERPARGRRLKNGTRINLWLGRRAKR
jgi:hypothetical protein